LTNISRSAESLETFQDGHRETYAFEIKTYVDNFFRSYFVRVDAIYECDSWIDEINICVKQVLKEDANKDSWLRKIQQRTRDFYGTHSVRCAVAFAILLEFLSCVFKSEFLPEPHSIADQFFKVLDIILCVFFVFELALNMFGNWRSVSGAPFLKKISNWFQVATVLFQLVAFSETAIEDFKVIRIIRIFDVGSAFKSLASCQMILKAIRRGNFILVICTFCLHSTSTFIFRKMLTTLPLSAVIPMSSALIILVFVTSSFAVISVHLFGDRDVLNFGDRSDRLFPTAQP
jgi:hypothetical protein